MGERTLCQTIEFRQIPNYSRYKAGVDGTITTHYKYTNGGQLPDGQYRYIVPRKGKDGYYYVSLVRDDKKRVSRRIHHLILETFIGPKPQGQQARHYPDRSKSNNCLSNLRWGTPKENANDRESMGTTARGTRNGMAKYSDDQVKLVRSLRHQGVSTRKIAQLTSMSRGNVMSIIKGRSRNVEASNL